MFATQTFEFFKTERYRAKCADTGKIISNLYVICLEKKQNLLIESVDN